MIFRGNGVVWDKDKGRALCRFTPAKRRGDKGSLETEKERTIKILVGLGFEYEGEMPEEKEISVGESPLEKLKAKATELGVKFAPNIGYDKLFERVRAAENDS